MKIKESNTNITQQQTILCMSSLYKLFAIEYATNIVFNLHLIHDIRLHCFYKRGTHAKVQHSNTLNSYNCQNVLCLQFFLDFDFHMTMCWKFPFQNPSKS